jgi:hypothetical protein
VEEIEDGELSSSCFGVPRKDGSIRFLIDFCQLNRIIKQKEYPLPTINKMFQNICGFTFALVIDLNMEYLSIPLTEPMLKLLTIVNNAASYGNHLLWIFFNPEWSEFFNQCNRTSQTHTLTKFLMVRGNF